MEKSRAKRIAETITNDQIEDMLDMAKKNIKDWTQRSNCNKSLSKGAAWNILANGFDRKRNVHYLVKVNLIREFGEFLPHDIRVGKPKEAKALPEIHHEEPKLN